LDLEAMPDATWHSLLQDVLVQYVTLLINSEGPAPSAPTLTRKQIIERDTARKEARAAAAASTAAATADGGGDSGGDGDDGGAAAATTPYRCMVTRTTPPRLRRPSRPQRRRPAAPREAGRPGPREEGVRRPS
jgi:hypothetical protein